jgi:uroporphyrinogen decarboxylase
MTSRERVLTALGHGVPDRVPIDFGGFQTGIHRGAYEALLVHLGIADDTVMLDPVQQLAAPCESVLERFHVDTRYVVAHGPDSFRGGIVVNERDGRLWHDLRDEFGVVWSMPDDQGLYMDITHHPLAGVAMEDIARYPFPKGNDPSRFTGVRDRLETMRRTTDFALVSGIGGVVYETCWYMRGLEQWLIDLVTQPEFCAALLDRVLDFWLGYYSEYMKVAGDLYDVVMIGDDLAAQYGPIFSPSIYRDIVKPRQKRLVQHIRSLTGAKIWYHTCGSCYQYIADLIDNGVDILNPVQIGLADMEPERLKREFGNRIVFWGGGVDAQHILPFASPEVVRDNVRANIAAFMPGGGYVFNNVHNIQYGVPPANIVALFDAAYEFGFYD